MQTELNRQYIANMYNNNTDEFSCLNEYLDVHNYDEAEQDVVEDFEANLSNEESKEPLDVSYFHFICIGEPC
jgi:hypothetical protein